MFDDWVYKRGALTPYALRLRIGDDAFFALLGHWTDKYRRVGVVPRTSSRSRPTTRRSRSASYGNRGFTRRHCLRLPPRTSGH